MQADILSELPPQPIAILGMNEAGQESGNPVICVGRTIPWLQDSQDVNVWHERWSPTYRDVVILDEKNVKIGVFNLTVNDLQAPANYDSLKSMLLRAAGSD
jgi:hypothetical protein